MLTAHPFLPQVRLALLGATALTYGLLAGEAPDEIFAIGPRRDPPAQVAGHAWFQHPDKIDDAFYTEALAAARLLAANPAPFPADLAELQSAISGEKAACAKAFLWLTDFHHCPDPLARRGSLIGLGLSAVDLKLAGNRIGACAVFDPDPGVRAASIGIIRQSKDPYAEAAVLNAWKSSFDNSGLPTVNEPQRKNAVAAMHDIEDKRIFQVLVLYATLELRAQTAAPVRVDQVAITGNGIRLPIDLPVVDIISAEGNLVIPALSSLKQASGQDFGHNLDKWNAWLAQKP